jgi:GNAT superfamily N-acetyltransferase
LLEAEKRKNMMQNFSIKHAVKEDVALILSFIKELAEFEKLAHEVVATEAILSESLFGSRPYAEAIIAYVNQMPVGFALFFHNFSTFLGRPGLYLEDLFVKHEARGLGIGLKRLSYLAKLAKERNCGRFEWWVLDWNSPAIEFYKRIGARPMDEWTVFRVSGDQLEQLAQSQ